MEEYDVIIIGAGPGGLATAIYTGRAGRNTALIERGIPGGLIATTDRVENYPGITDISGAELADRFKEHAEKFGAEIIRDEVTSVKVSGAQKVARSVRDEYRAPVLVVASGSAPRSLEVSGEDRLRGRGVSYCATCDGAFFRDRPVACVGGGDAAVQEAVYLTRFASEVYLIHRRDELRAVRELQRRAEKNDGLQVIWNSVVREIQGEERVENLLLCNVRSGEESTLSVDGVFIYIGSKPATGFLDQKVKLTEEGYIPTDDHMRTDVPGVFAVGDVRERIQRQISTAVGDGATAAMAIEEYLADRA